MLNKKAGFTAVARRSYFAPIWPIAPKIPERCRSVPAIFFRTAPK